MLSLHAAEDADPSGRCAVVIGLVALLSDAGVSRRLLHAAADSVLGTAGEDAVPVMDAAAGRLADSSLELQRRRVGAIGAPTGDAGRA